MRASFRLLVAVVTLICLSNLYAQPWKGDVDRDGSIDITDALTIVNNILGVEYLSDEEIVGADCNLENCRGDGVINVLDVLRIIQIILNTYTCPETQFADNVVFADQVNGLSLLKIEGETFYYRFQGSVPFSPGDIILEKTKGGHLRYIESITTNQDTAVVVTRPAALTEAILGCNIETTFDLRLDSDSCEAKPGDETESPTWRYYLSNKVIFDGNAGGVNVKAWIPPVSYIEIGAGADFCLKISWFSLKCFRVAVDGHFGHSVDVQVDAEGDFLLEKETNIVTLNGSTVWVGPIAIMPVLDLDAGIVADLEMYGTMSAGCESDVHITLGVEYIKGSGWDDISSWGSEFVEHDFTWDFDAYAMVKGYIKPKISFMIYSVVGPYAQAEPYLAFLGNVHTLDWTEEICWDWELAAGVDGAVGISGGFLWWDFGDWEMVDFGIFGPKTLANDEYCPALPAPQLVSPLNGLALMCNPPDFYWHIIDPAYSYGLIVDDDSLFSSPVIDVSDYHGCLFHPSEPLPRQCKYYWKVAAYDRYGHRGLWSETWMFFVP